MELKRVVRRAKDRWVAAGYPDYALWVPLFFHGFIYSAMGLAVAQRTSGGHGPEAAGLVGLSAVAYTVGEALGPRFHWTLFAVTTMAPLGVLSWLYPVDFDFNLFTIALLVGRFSALEPVRRSAVVFAATLVGIAAMGVHTDFSRTGFAVATILAGWDMGWLMQTQQRRIDQQARDHEQRARQAALEERQRIAREVHDVIAHSLSVTMLHLTAARRMLEEDDDVPEAIDALRDAERQGRQAMTDIRQTVGLLGSATAEVAPLPDLTALPDLVAGFRAAGLQVELDVKGDLARVPSTTALGLYRIAQESLSNIAKHEPTAAARMTVDVRNGQLLVVANDLRHPARPVSDEGAGIRGMAERAELLGGRLAAGPRDGRWVVELEVPGELSHLGRLKCLLGLAPRLDSVRRSEAGRA